MKLDQTHQRILSETAQRIFEEAAFALTDPPEIEQPAERSVETQISSAVEFTGPFSGILTISAPEKLARTLAANMMGFDESETDTSVKPSDALGEILNMICGNLLPAIAGTGPEFRILAPRQVNVENARLMVREHPFERAVQVEISVEGSRTEIALLLDVGKAHGVFQ